MQNHSEQLKAIRTFPQLVKYLRDELDWPINQNDFEGLTFDYTPEELGIDLKVAAKILEIKRLRPLTANQPWGIFFIKFEPKRLPVVALRRMLKAVALKKRATADSADRLAWETEDLLFISNYGEEENRQITFAQFTQNTEKKDLPTLKVLGWDNLDTTLHLNHVAESLATYLTWPEDEDDTSAWRSAWGSAFSIKHREVIDTSKKLSGHLARLARNIRDRINTVLEYETENGPITKLMNAFKEVLVHDLDNDGFADMYAQTIAYGLLSARIANPSSKTSDDFASAMPVTNPFLKELMETFIDVGGRDNKQKKSIRLDFDELGVSEVVELLDNAKMEAVVRDFGDKNPLEDPVTHFYEQFFADYDNSERFKRGVFYTPRPVVSFIVRSVDQLLREKFDLIDGLADTSTWSEMAERLNGVDIPAGVDPEEPFVQILDPATGTGTFLVEVIHLIHKTMSKKWMSQGLSTREVEDLWNQYVPNNLLPRLHGYELMMAPYAISHMKLGLKLYETGYRFESKERARVYLTNSLEPVQDYTNVLELAIPALAHEAKSVNQIKDGKLYTVIVGNPPYAGHSSNNNVAWIVNMVHDYKRGYDDLNKPGQAKWLQDDYVKFIRFVEDQISRTGLGIIGFITNHAWLENPTFKGMRKHILNNFSHIDVLDLHGNANRGEVAPSGGIDQNVFAIRQGVAISFLVSTVNAKASSENHFRRIDIWGSEKNKHEFLTNNTVDAAIGKAFTPFPPSYVFREISEARDAEYQKYLSIPDIFSKNGDPAPGIVTTHDQFAIAFTEEEQKIKILSFLKTNSEKEARSLFRLCSQSQWSYEVAMRVLKKDDWEAELEPITYRPFDTRCTVYNRHVAVHRRERVSKHMLGMRNIGLSIPRACEIKRGWEHAFCSKNIIQHHTVSIKEVNYLFPLWLAPEWPEVEPKYNLSEAVLDGISNSTDLLLLEQATLGYTDDDYKSPNGRGDLTNNYGPRDVFDYVYCILHSNEYRARYSESLKGDFARIPLPNSKNLFVSIVRLGRLLSDNHILESPNLTKIGVSFIGGSQIVEKVTYSSNTVWIEKERTCGFTGVSQEVWDYHIGGGRVCEKWLKDRQEKGGKNPRPGRHLNQEDIEHYQKIIVAISETIRITGEIDEVIEEHGGWPGAFQP